MVVQSSNANIIQEVTDYYTDKVLEHGTTPEGVDWNGTASQELRFEQLSKILDSLDGFSINDLGCGYGALFNFLQNKCSNFSYTGVDVSPAMIEKAKEQIKSPFANFEIGSEPKEIADFSVASGIYNVRQNQPDDEWLSYIKSTLDVLDRTSRKGFSFNALTSYSAPDKMRDYLYYADPCMLFDYVKRKYSNQVALLHDYGLYEFTILVRK